MGKRIKKRKSRRGRKKKLFRLKKFLASLFLILAGLIGGRGGYEYYRTGSIENTVQALKETGEFAQELPQQAEELGGMVQKQLSQWTNNGDRQRAAVLPDEIPAYSGSSYVEVNGNIPSFSDEERNREPFEYYSELDELGRCGYAEAKITPGLMPTEERGQIGMIRPSGWHTVKYSGIDGNYLYNRCHLIAYQLTGENANEKNLITGTRYLNVEGMLPWENMVTDYIHSTGDAVLYRVTPVYKGDNLVASGVQMEAESLGSEDIRFNIFVYNVQPGIGIDYANGDSWQE